MSFFSAGYRAGYEAGLRDGREGKPLGLFAEQQATPFGRGYVVGHRAALVGRQETWADAIAQEHGFTQISHTLELFGLCASCSSA